MAGKSAKGKYDYTKIGRNWRTTMNEERSSLARERSLKLTRVLSLRSISDDNDSNHARGQTAVSDASLIGFDTRPNQEASRSCGSPGQ